MSELIEWTKGAKYWTGCYNPVVGCKKISEGCQNCYADGVVKRFGINGGSFEPTAMPRAKPPKSGVVFVGNMTDIFGEWVEDYDLVTYLTSLRKSAVNLILTKRPSRETFLINNHSKQEHLWFGVTCENQDRADERIPDLLKANVAHRWLSCEPLLGEIKFKYGILSNINWVVVGAESGANRRPCKIEWVESIVEQCQAANVPVFVKQLDLNGKLEKDINKFPEHLRIRQVPWKQ